MTWYVGQEVVCINDDWQFEADEDFKIVPVNGQIYTIREIEQGVDGDDSPYYFLLNEIVNPPFQYDDVFAETVFASHGFRPVVKTSISIFTEILERETIPSTEKEKV